MDLANCYLFIKKERSVEQNKEPKKKERKIDKNKNKNIEIDGLFYRGEKKKKTEKNRKERRKTDDRKRETFFQQVRNKTGRTVGREDTKQLTRNEYN